jgi:hypothetical protein
MEVPPESKKLNTLEAIRTHKRAVFANNRVEIDQYRAGSFFRSTADKVDPFAISRAIWPKISSRNQRGKASRIPF